MWRVSDGSKSNIAIEKDRALLELLLSSKCKTKFSIICNANLEVWGYPLSPLRRQVQNRRRYLQGIQASKGGAAKFLKICRAQGALKDKDHGASIVDQLTRTSVVDQVELIERDDQDLQCNEESETESEGNLPAPPLDSKKKLHLSKPTRSGPLNQAIASERSKPWYKTRSKTQDSEDSDDSSYVATIVDEHDNTIASEPARSKPWYKTRSKTQDLEDSDDSSCVVATIVDEEHDQAIASERSKPRSKTQDSDDSSYVATIVDKHDPDM
jgi:hypothetical protein